MGYFNVTVTSEWLRDCSNHQGQGLVRILVREVGPEAGKTHLHFVTPFPQNAQQNKFKGVISD